MKREPGSSSPDPAQARRIDARIGAFGNFTIGEERTVKQGLSVWGSPAGRHGGCSTSNKSTFRGQALSAADLKWIRNQIERLDGVNAVDDELRELVESQWPDLAFKLPPRTLQ